MYKKRIQRGTMTRNMIFKIALCTTLCNHVTRFERVSTANAALCFLSDKDGVWHVAQSRFQNTTQFKRHKTQTAPNSDVAKFKRTTTQSSQDRNAPQHTIRITILIYYSRLIHGDCCCTAPILKGYESQRVEMLMSRTILIFPISKRIRSAKG